MKIAGTKTAAYAIIFSLAVIFELLMWVPAVGNPVYGGFSVMIHVCAAAWGAIYALKTAFEWLREIKEIDKGKH